MNHNFALGGATARFKKTVDPSEDTLASEKREKRRIRDRNAYLKKHPNANPTNRRRIRPLPELVASVASGSADPWDAGMGDMSPPPPELPVVATGIYQEMPHGALTSFLPEIGVSIDPRSPYAVWAGRYLTRLPYIPSEADPDVNALAFLHKHLSRLVPAAVDARGSSYVDYITYSPDVVALGQRIRCSMAEGRVVVVQGCTDAQRIALTSSDLLRYLHIDKGEEFQAQDCLLRETEFSAPYETLTMDQFLENMADPNKIQAILDTKSVNVHHPLLIGHVDEGYHAVDKTAHLFDDVPVDMKASRVWSIEHQPLFHTLVHHDASGMGTWTSIASGQKFWLIVVSDHGAHFKTRHELHVYNDRYRMTHQGDWDFPYAGGSKWFCIFGETGDIIIQPPNTWHEVYTPQTSVTIGGHFYTYDTLHLTDAARCYDIKVPGTTNQHHSSSQLILCAMMVDITRRGPRGYHTKPLTSLCRMLLIPEHYLSINEDAQLRSLLIRYLRNPRLKGVQVVVKRAIAMARYLVKKLKLRHADDSHLFEPPGLAWTEPGCTIPITQDIISGMVQAAGGAGVNIEPL